jgi:hypothetical protein
MGVCSSEKKKDAKGEEGKASPVAAGESFFFLLSISRPISKSGARCAGPGGP